MSKQYTNAEIGQALVKSAGMVYIAARLLNCSHVTIYNRLEKNAKLRQVREVARGLMLDTAELELFNQIRAGEMWAIKFYLTTQGRERGYGEVTDDTPDDGRPTFNIMELAQRARQGQIVEGEFKALEPDTGHTNGKHQDGGS